MERLTGGGVGGGWRSLSFLVVSLGVTVVSLASPWFPREFRAKSACFSRGCRVWFAGISSHNSRLEFFVRFSSSRHAVP